MKKAILALFANALLITTAIAATTADVMTPIRRRLQQR
ncbi:archaellum component FlaG (FlaF/FlaG flagellin family) [Tunturiibacter psychrotolerans]